MRRVTGVSKYPTKRLAAPVVLEAINPRIRTLEDSACRSTWAVLAVRLRHLYHFTVTQNRLDESKTRQQHEQTVTKSISIYCLSPISTCVAVHCPSRLPDQSVRTVSRHFRLARHLAFLTEFTRSQSSLYYRHATLVTLSPCLLQSGTFDRAKRALAGHSAVSIRRHQTARPDRPGPSLTEPPPS